MNHINSTLNATIDATARLSQSFSTWLAGTFFPTLIERILVLLTAPGHYPRMIYIITPMLITLFLMEFYFGRYKQEELGWNTAVGNALVLIFVSVDLLKTTFQGLSPLPLVQEVFHALANPGELTGAFVSTAITLLIFAAGMLLLLTDFFHWLPKRFAFALSGSLPINLTAYIGIVIVYSHNTGQNPVPIDGYTFLAALCLFFALLFFFGLVHFLEPKQKEEEKRSLPPSDDGTYVIGEEEAEKEYKEDRKVQDD